MLPPPGVLRRAAHAGILAAALIALVLIVRHIGTDTILAMLRQVGWTFALVTTLYAAHTALRGVTLWQTLPPGSIRLGRVIRIRFGAEGVEMLTLTGPFMAEPAKAWLLHRHGLHGPEAIGAVVAEYLLYNLTAAWMTAGSLALLLVRGVLPHPFRVPADVLLVCIALLTAACALAAVTGKGLVAPAVDAILNRVAPRRAALVGAGVRRAEAPLVSLLHDHPRRLAAVLGVELTGHALLALEVLVVLDALGFHAGLVTAFIIEGAIKSIAGLFFFVPGQIGVAEGVYAMLLPLLGLPAAAGVTISLIRRARALVVGALGFLISARAPMLAGRAE